MPAQHPLGQRPPVLLQAFAGGLQASWRLENCHQLNVNGGMQRVNHTMAQMLAMAVNELQNNWDV